MCPYAVVSFQYKGKEATATPMAAHRYIFMQENIHFISTFLSVFKCCFYILSLTGLTLFPLKEVKVKKNTFFDSSRYNNAMCCCWLSLK